MTRTIKKKSNDPNAVTCPILPSEALSLMQESFPGLDAESLRAYLLAQRVVGEIRLAMDCYLQKYRISRGRFAVLAILSAADTRVLKPSELAKRCSVTRATMTGLLDGLEECGLVQRVENEKDRRAIQVKLTGQGTQLMRRILPHHFKRVQTIMRGIKGEKRSVLISALEMMQGNIKNI